MEHDEFNHYIQDLSIEDLKKNLHQTNEHLLEALRERFTQNLLTSMIFFIFNHICASEVDNFAKKRIARKQIFFLLV